MAVEIVTLDGVSEEPVPGSIEAVAIGSSGRGLAEDLRFPKIEVPGKTVLALDDEHVWRLQLRAPGFWSRAEVLALGQRSIRLDAWATGAIHGTLEVPRGHDEPKEIEARFQSAPASPEEETGSPELSTATVECPVEGDVFTCELPATDLDLRLRAEGFISHYLWDLPIRPDKEKDLGSLALEPGASVVGFVAATEGPIDEKTVRVELFPDVAAPARTPAAQRRREAGRLEAGVNERGFFQFLGIAPGQYRLSASQPGYAAASVHPVNVLPRAESSFKDPLLLRRPANLEIYLDPPQDPYGEPWQIRLERRGAIPGVLESVSEGKASMAGELTAKGLTPGRFVVRVSDSQGDQLAWEEVEVDEASPPLFLDLDVIWIEGEVLLGDDPLEAELTFGGRSGPRKIELSSDEDGVFGGFLPEQGEWDVFVESEFPAVNKTVTVEVEPVDDLAEIEIRLPNTRVRGRVKDSRGKPVEGALVKATEMSDGYISWKPSGPEGRFSFHGFSEGPLALDAKAGEDLSSDPSVVHVSEDAVPPPVELVLRQRTALRGVVVSSSGPVPGCSVTGIAKRGGVEYPFMVRPRAVTDMRGEFELHVPEDADTVEVILLPPGYALTPHTITGVPHDPVRLPVIEHGGEVRLAFTGSTGWQMKRSAPSPVVSVDGVLLDTPLLTHWARLKLVDVTDPSQMRLPQMPPGDYTACWLTFEHLARSYAESGGGASAPGRECVEGYLPPYGTLDLALAAVEEATETDSEGATE